MHRTMISSCSLLVLPLAALADPLPSWNDTDTKAAIISFVESVTDPSADAFVPEPDRIAVFDNDGTLWSEQPLYFQFSYALDMFQQKAEADPSILTSDALKAAADGDLSALRSEGTEGLLEMVNVSHANITPDAFQASVHDWLTTTAHPTTGLTYAEMTYQPMVELLRYLRDEEFSTYIVSGGTIDFMRAIAEEAYGIPPSQIIGSIGNLSYSVDDGVPTLTKDAGLFFVDRTGDKPVGIMNHIGKRPIFAAGNSDADWEMVEWTTAGDGARFGMFVHHTDDVREVAYDRGSPIGALDRVLDEAESRGWVLVDMANDWGRIWSGDQ